MASDFTLEVDRLRALAITSYFSRLELPMPNEAYKALYKLSRQVQSGWDTKFWDDAFTIAMKRVRARERAKAAAWDIEGTPKWFGTYDALVIE